MYKNENENSVQEEQYKKYLCIYKYIYTNVLICSYIVNVLNLCIPEEHLT